MSKFNFRSSLQSYLDMSKRISKLNLPNNAKEACEYIENTIQAINSCGTYTLNMDGQSLKEIRVPDWFAQFVYPIKVSVLPGDNLPDLVKRPQYPENYHFDQNEIARLNQIIMGSHKAGHLAKLVTVESLRGEERVLSAVNPEVKGMVKRDGGELFWPVPLIDEVLCIYDGWGFFNMESDTMKGFYMTQRIDIIPFAGGSGNTSSFTGGSREE